MPTDRRTILVTSALPYANGSIHLGHMLEYIQTDIWVRYQKQSGHRCVYVCADDAHGTAIMLRAETLGITPEELIADVRAEHEADFNGFHIGFDHYSSTHSEANRRYSELIYSRVRDAGGIAVRTISQLFDPEKELFLADRYVKGTCPSVVSMISTAITAKRAARPTKHPSLRIQNPHYLARHLFLRIRSTCSSSSGSIQSS